MMHTGALLCERSVAGLEPLGAFNQPVHRIFAQIRMALLNELGADCADYFSRPDVKREGEAIGWFAQLPGEPRRWVDLTPEEQAALEPVKQDVRRRLDAYVARLAATPDNSSSNNFGKVLAQALQVPSPDCLYFMNRQPVVVFWGFKNAGVPVGIEPLSLPVQRIPMPDRPGLGPLDAPPVATEHAVALPRRRRWWRWLLGALLLALLLGTAWWWFFHRSVPVRIPGMPTSLGARSVPSREGPEVGMGGLTGRSAGVSGALPQTAGAVPTVPALGGAGALPSAPSAGAPSVPDGAPADGAPSNAAPPNAGPPNVPGLPPLPPPTPRQERASHSPSRPAQCPVPQASWKGCGAVGRACS